MRVTPPPLPVPRLMVVNSRTTLSSPMTSSVRSPANFLSCGSPPTAAWPWKWLLRPMRVGPVTEQCGPRIVPSPISTSAPTTQNGPMRTPSPSFAPASTTAVGWTWALIASGLDLGAQDVGAGDLLAVHARDARVQRHVADRALELDLQRELVARHHHLREL